MEQGYFITGTDTNIGKTWATVALMQYFKNQGKSVIGMKPVASGCTLKDGMLVNDDALLLQEHATVKLDYRQINPYAFSLPVSPHIAGKDNPVDLAVIVDGFNAISDYADAILVEGAGGWYSPLNESQDNSDLAAALGLPVLLVVAIRLGCINHAKLSYQAIISSGVSCAGWIAVCTDPNERCIEENIAMIKKRLDAPLRGVLPYKDVPNFDELAGGYSFAASLLLSQS
ncbi:ATP-dependent dethiobiotin synthetase BioD [Methyloglobulus morosus KoM1]|uniref:ATP-dependent dethiobiotin synthetase BioD n=1 Tax=Methyloglobulus morosus KoM1 TaxID=1116472 RepID=V5BG85_9GAMM|nr:dethiobiotin synthase [Methyloglobulus morosus]ESS72315.1 ATP-dependent dethiobiotin synthetase BioD [Methyloglobulus morosus KoM1]